MRDILFRGKRLDNGEWVEGWYVHTKRHHCIITGCIDDGYVVYGHYASDVAMYVVDPATVGQYTGLNDKNGKRIFEGDMLKPFDDDLDKAVVDFHDGQFMLCIYGDRWCEEGNYGAIECEPLSSYGDDIEIIGNIHDNPELIGGEG